MSLLPSLPLSRSLLPSFLRSLVVLLGATFALAGCGQMLVTDLSEDSGIDAAHVDAHAPDASDPDASDSDASDPDASDPDASDPDASDPDGSAPDGSAPLDARDTLDAHVLAMPDAISPDAAEIIALPDAFSLPDAHALADAFASSDAFAPVDAFAPDAAVLDAATRDASRSDAGMPRGVELGAASPFAILAASTVTSTGFSMVTGNIGLIPGPDVVGFPPAVISGTFHIGDATAAAAALALTDAYDDAAARMMPAPASVSGNLGGMTLAPGIYVSGSSLEISSGDLTLDAFGDPNATWIFQMPSTFTATSSRQVVLSGGARATNVYWQVGSSATLGSNSRIVGNFLVDQSVTLETGARLDGRALTRVGAVTLDGAVIVVPTP